MLIDSRKFKEVVELYARKKGLEKFGHNDQFKELVGVTYATYTNNRKKGRITTKVYLILKERGIDVDSALVSY